MRIRLFVDHTALLENDRRVEVTIEPACEGVLEIEGEKIPMKNGSASPYLPRIIGHVGVTFTTSAGVRYKGINPHMKDGVPFSALDYAGGYASMLIRMDDMAREIRQLNQELMDLWALIEPDSLGFLNIGGEKEDCGHLSMAEILKIKTFGGNKDENA